MNKQTITHRPENRTITDLVNLHEDGLLNLEPGFQRKSVWNPRDRAKMIDSILRNYPLPAVFLYRREDNGQIIYDVIDGKQRIESILMFMGVMRGRYGLKTQLPGSEETEWLDWKRLCKRKLQPLITGYRIPAIEVDGEIADIIDIFVRINSTRCSEMPKPFRLQYWCGTHCRSGPIAPRRVSIASNPVSTASDPVKIASTWMWSIGPSSIDSGNVRARWATSSFSARRQGRLRHQGSDFFTVAASNTADLCFSHGVAFGGRMLA